MRISTWPGNEALNPKTVPLESHSLTAAAFAKIAFSAWTKSLEPKHLILIIIYYFSTIYKK